MTDVLALLGPGILLATPILYAALGGLFTQRAGIFNIALEGFMLLAAYFAVTTAVSTGSLLWGTLAGIVAATVTGAVTAVLVVGFRADEVIVGIAVNVFAVGLTTFLLADAQDSGRPLELPAGYPRLDLTWLQDVPLLGPIFNDRDLLVWALIPAVIGVIYTFHRTGFGLRLQAAGEAPLAARAAGVRVAGVRFAAIVISGAFSGVAGAELAIGSVHLFSENMTSGRGIIAFAAVIFGAGMVNRTVAACLLFGFAQALAGLLQIRTAFPSQFVLMVPFLLTIAALTVSDALRGQRTRRPREQGNRSNRPGTELPRVVVAGHLTIDEVRLPDGGTHPATTGGAAAYVALGAFLADGDVTVVARVGEDYPVQRLQLNHPDGGQVHTDGVKVLPGRSIHNVARYGPDGSRVFDIEDFDVLKRLSPEPADLNGLQLQGQWVLVAPGTLAQQNELVKALKRAGALVALDTELHYLTQPDALQRLRNLTRAVDCFLPSLEHVRHLFDADITADPADLKTSVEFFGCPITIVKCGSRGAVVFDAADALGVRIPAVTNLQMQDPTGAGDGFNGGCLVALARGERPVAAAATGCVAASFVIQAVGIEIPEVFSRTERAARRQKCSPAGAAKTRKEENVQR